MKVYHCGLKSTDLIPMDRRWHGVGLVVHRENIGREISYGSRTIQYLCDIYRRITTCEGFLKILYFTRENKGAR